ncbi:MAG: hypothetical protein C0483_18760 [Pirellula sp.]|nr:hypothetical protein [Pirellula sp.]
MRVRITRGRCRNPLLKVDAVTRVRLIEKHPCSCVSAYLFRGPSTERARMKWSSCFELNTRVMTMTLIELLEQHYSVQRIISISYDRSIRNVVRNFERYMRAAHGKSTCWKCEIADLSDEQLRGFAAWFLRQKKSRATVNKSLRTLMALANFARREDLTDYRPDVAKLPEARQQPVSWRPEEFAKIIGGIHDVFGDSKWGRMLFSIVMVNYDTGLRIIDALSIESNVLDYQKGIVYVTEQKTGKRRSFVLHRDTMAAIKNAFGVYDGGHVLRYPHKETNPLRVRLRKVLEHVGLPFTRRDLFQKIRRLTANEARAAGMNATEVLGHSASWVTDTFYLDPDATPPMDVAHRIRRPRLPPDQPPHAA